MIAGCDNCNNQQDTQTSIQPFCDQCTENEVNCGSGSMDAACVFYHLNRNNPSKLTCLNFGNNTSLETILEGIDKLACNKLNFTLNATDSNTIDFSTSGPAKHNLTGVVKFSDDVGNIAESRPDGVFVPAPIIPSPIPPDHKVSVDATDPADYLETQIVGSVHDWLTLTVDKVVVSGLNKKLVINSAIDFDALCEAISTCKCSTAVSNLAVTFAAPCPSSYSLNDDGTLCIHEDTAVPTVSEDIVEACEAFYTEYSQYGAIVYKAGFKPNGTGVGATLGGDIAGGNVVAITTNEVWRNNAAGGDNIGPANRTGVWSCESIGTGSLGFSVPVSVPTTKKYYIAIAADDRFVLKVNGVTIVDNQSVTPGTTYYLDGGAMFRYWHIYPITLVAGVNYLDILGVDTDGVSSVLGAEVYDNTLAQLQAATLKTAFTTNRAGFPLDQNPYNNLNLVFTTRCARQSGSVFTVGNATCPDSSWTLDTSGGDPLIPPCQGINSDTSAWVCKKITTLAFPGYSGTLVWDRLNEAINYQIQQKLASDPIGSYVDSVGSPVDNPDSGSTVSAIIEGLPSQDMSFRIRPNYGSCFGPWDEPS